MPNQPDDCIVGFTRGGTQTPPTTDFSTGLPASVSTDADGLEWVALNRPIIGATQAMQLRGIPAPSQSIGLVVLGYTSIPNGADLGFVGAPGCSLYTQSAAIQVISLPIVGNQQTYILPIPNNASLSGSIVNAQGAVMMPPTMNSLGALTCNAIELKLGTQ